MDDENPACSVCLAANRASELAHALVMAGDDGLHGAPDAPGAFLNGGALSPGVVGFPRREGLPPRPAVMRPRLGPVAAQGFGGRRRSTFLPHTGPLLAA